MNRLGHEHCEAVIRSLEAEITQLRILVTERDHRQKLLEDADIEIASLRKQLSDYEGIEAVLEATQRSQAAEIVDNDALRAALSVANEMCTWMASVDAWLHDVHHGPDRIRGQELRARYHAAQVQIEQGVMFARFKRKSCGHEDALAAAEEMAEGLTRRVYNFGNLSNVVWAYIVADRFRAALEKVKT